MGINTFCIVHLRITHGGNGCLKNHKYQGSQNRHYYYTSLFRSSHTDYDQWDFNHRGSTRSSNLLHNTYPHENSDNVFSASNATTSNLETPQNARATLFESNSLASVMIKQTIIQAVLTSIKMFDGTKSKSEAWVESIESAAQISGQNTIHIAFSEWTGPPLLAANRLKPRLPNLTWTELKKHLSMQYSYHSIWYSCDPGFHSFETRSIWASQQLPALYEWASVKNLPHCGHF